MEGNATLIDLSLNGAYSTSDGGLKLGTGDEGNARNGNLSGSAGRVSWCYRAKSRYKFGMANHITCGGWEKHRME
ncbi:hypothetical protein U1Q18_045946 [Sarracenia purpurea var. burkii]